MGVWSGVDICFNYKNGKYEKPFEMPKNLNKRNLEKLAKKYEERYSYLLDLEESLYPENGS